MPILCENTTSNNSSNEQRNKENSNILGFQILILSRSYGF